MENKKQIGLYEVSVILFFVLFPLGAITTEIFICKSGQNIVEIMLKWFVFSGIGLRLFTAGIKQVFSPSFTVKQIFGINEENCFVFVREIGLANISFGILGILSLLLSELRLAAALAGGLYLGMAGFMHLFKEKGRKRELFAMVSDFFMFFVLIILVCFSFCK